MNRTIKFRGRRTDGAGWVFGYYFTTPLTAEYNILPENGAFFDCGRDARRHVIADENGCVFDVIPETVGQFTGCRDRNGRDIYEGDFVKFIFSPEFIRENRFGEVRWFDNNDAHWALKAEDGKEYHIDNVWRTGELAGNIHEYHSIV
jgi:hypothetical protein